MSYQTGTATSPADLLSTLETWLAAIGWTLDGSGTDGSGRRAHLHKGTSYVNLRAAAAETIFSSQAGVGTGIGLYLGTGYASGDAWNAQAGGPVGSGTSNIVGSFCPLPSGSITAYYFFSDTAGDNVIVVVERSSGIFVWFGWGNLSTAGTITGGAYFGANCQGYYANSTYFATATSDCPYSHSQRGNQAAATYVRVDVDTFTSKWIGIDDITTTVTRGYTGKFGASTVQAQYDPPASTPGRNADQHQLRRYSDLNNQFILDPIRLMAARDAGGYSIVGTVPQVFFCSGTDNGLSAGDEKSLSGDSYKIFPNFAVKKVVPE